MSKERASSKRGGLSRSSVDFVSSRVGVLGTILLFVTLWFERDAMAGASAQAILVVVGLAVGFAAVLTAIVVSGVLFPAMTRQSDDLTQVLRSVAQGDLSREPATGDDGDHDPLVDAARSALATLKTSVSEVRGAAEDVSNRAQHIASQFGVASSVAQRASESASSLTHHGATVAELTHAAHTEVQKIIGGMREVTDEIKAQRVRDARIRELSQETLVRLRSGNGSIDALSVAVDASAGELQALAGASEEIRSFVTFVRKMARQSKLLALNAAMEAARAGEQGSGFGVVASEVRRLARTSSEAADRTDRLVGDVLERLERLRGASAQAVEALGVVRQGTSEGLTALEQLGAEAGSAVDSARAEEQRLGGTGAAAEALVLRVEQLAQEADSLAHAVSEAATVTTAQQMRVQEIAVAVTALSRATSRLLAASAGMRMESADSALSSGADAAAASALVRTVAA